MQERIGGDMRETGHQREACRDIMVGIIGIEELEMRDITQD
jgi:hypothetical protein